MADAPFSPMAAPPPLREAAPALPGRLEAMQQMQQSQKGGSPTDQAKEIGVKILEMIHAMPESREKLTQALRLITEAATESLSKMPTAGITGPPPTPGAGAGGAPMPPPGLMPARPPELG